MRDKQQKIMLTDAVQIFRAVGQKLERVGFIDEGSFFNIGEPVSKTWDHHEQPAVPFQKGGEELYILVKELNEEQRRLIIPVSVH